uniref:Lipase lipRs n=1 Tax=Rhizopus stolonifer TaxID=4846 RepID=Q45FB3_RHIST|nr:lipase lipRs [Rhizopus stolonifer]
MVSFISITQGVSLCLLVSSMMMGSSAVPVSGKTGASSDAVSTSGNFTLPPIISSRCAPPSGKGSSSDLQSEPYFVKKNTEWYTAHGGDLAAIGKRDDNQVGGMTLDLPENAPPIASSYSLDSVSDSSVVAATAAQVQELTKYAGVAATAYCRSVVPGNKWDCKQCLKWVPDGKIITTFTSILSDTNGYVLRSDKQKTIYLVFRGTNSFRSAITDIVFNFSNYKPVSGAKVHTGFLSSYEQVVNDYFPVIQAQLTANPSYQVIVTGHSLGGAQALLAGMDLYQREKRLSPKNLSIFTIGGPRVENPTFAYYVESTGIPFHRTVHKRDIVPHVPPQAMGFLHPGVESWIKSGDSNVQICNSQIETKACSNSIVPFTSIADHLSYFGINEGSCL